VNGCYPLDPFEAAFVGDDEAQGRAVAVGEGLARHMVGEEHGMGFGQGKAACVTGDGFHGDADGRIYELRLGK
jgi:hypothetical protein